MVPKSFEVGDLVWAKMKGYSPWPGKIIEPPVNAKAKKYHHYVFFFGSDNHAWIPDGDIFLHNESLIVKYGNKKKTALFQTAVKTIIEKSKGNSKYKQTESFEMHSNDDASLKDNENSLDTFDSRVSSPPKSSHHSNNVPKKIKKKLTKKKFSPSKKIVRKRVYSSDRSETDDYSLTKYSRHEGAYTVRDIKKRPLQKKPSREDRLSSDASGDEDRYVSEGRSGVSLEDNYIDLLANIPPNIGYVDVSASTPSTGILSRKYIQRPPTPKIDLTYISDALKTKAIEPYPKTIGFLGLSQLGQGIIKNLHQTGHNLLIWNNTPEEIQLFKDKLNINIATTPADVVQSSDITLCCLSDAEAAKALFFGNCGVLRGIESCAGQNKGYIEMTSMDPKVSRAISEEVTTKGGRYLEAPLTGSRIDADDGTLLILAAGDKSLYTECESCLKAVSKHHKYISAEVGTASKLSIIHNSLVGAAYAAVAESLALVSRTSLKPDDFLEILKYGVLNSDELLHKGHAMINKKYVNNTSLKHVQKSLDLGLTLGSEIGQPTPILAMANEVYKHCKLMRYGDHDVCAVYEGTSP